MQNTQHRDVDDFDLNVRPAPGMELCGGLSRAMFGRMSSFATIAIGMIDMHLNVHVGSKTIMKIPIGRRQHWPKLQSKPTILVERA